MILAPKMNSPHEQNSIQLHNINSQRLETQFLKYNLIFNIQMSLQSSQPERHSSAQKYIKISNPAHTIVNCNILRLLSYALSTSLNNYFSLLKIPELTTQTQPNTISLNNSSSQNKSPQPFNKKLTIIKQKEDFKDQPQKKYQQPQNNNGQSQTKDKKELLISNLPTNVNLSCKPNEGSNTRQGKKQNNKKTSTIVNKINQDKIEIPQIDLIGESYLPKFGLSEDQIRNTREGILQRKVQHWQIKSKNQRLKRQVRLLLG